MALKTRDIAPRIATEIVADRKELLSGEHAATIRELLERRGVLVFPEIGFSDDEQVAFTQTLGNLAPELAGEISIKNLIAAAVVPEPPMSRTSGPRGGTA